MKGKPEQYDHQKVEAAWAKKWRESRLDRPEIVGKRPFYNLMMFPYPSAEGLHVGNMYAFTGSDIYGRFKRMQGYDVLEPIGLDGFGIHSENYAFKVGRHPMDQAQISQKGFYGQLTRIGAMFDWDRTLETYDPSYYRWTQWLFLQMFKHGLAYRAKSEVNWCPSCKTVLADEQVVAQRATILSEQGESKDLIQSVCERCGNSVVKKLLEQWFFRITAYAEKLLENIPSLDWSEKVKVAQTNWIGKKEGIMINYPIIQLSNNPIQINKTQETISVFTTRPDTNFGATFVVIAPEHPFIDVLLDSEKVKPFKLEGFNLKRIRAYVEQAKKKTPEERIAAGRKKTGVASGLYCVNQLNGYRMPLFVSDFVLMGFGTGAVVGVPGHDLRDFEFAIPFDIPVKRVVVGADGDTSAITKKEQVQESEGTMINSGFLDGLGIHEATGKMIDYLEEKGWGKRVTTYHLRDWLISRQRYWGPPIPMVFCKTCEKGNKGEREDMPGWWTVPEDQLPVVLPRIEDYKPGDDGVAPLAKHKEFYKTTCPGCGGPAVRETDVSDTFLDSSWYFLRYPSLPGAEVGTPWFSPRQGPDLGGIHQLPSAKAVTGLRKGVPPRAKLPWDSEITKHWLPVHMYTGGAEHSVLHLLYSRFVTMALHDWGYLEFEEPFTRFYAHGLVIKDGAKMSKSKGNVVAPDEYIASYGADALRLYLMFMGPFDAGGDFRDTAMEGMSRWVGRVWRLALASLGNLGDLSNVEIKKALHRLVKKVTADIEKRRYNTAIAAMMEFTNLVEDQPQGRALSTEQLKTFILLLAPFAPYLAEELWQRCKMQDVRVKKKTRLSSDIFYLSSFGSVHLQPWPSYDPSMLEEDSVEIIVQVNGKLRDTIREQRAKSKEQSEVEKAARKSEKVQKYLEGKTVKKVIFVPGKLINFVV